MRLCLCSRSKCHNSVCNFVFLIKMDGISKLNEFLSIHQPQLQLSGVPKYFWQALYQKLRDQVFDAGEVFQVCCIDYEDQEKMPHDPTWSVTIIKEGGLKAKDESNIYLVDHAWTFRVHQAKRQLREIPGLLERMFGLMGLGDVSNVDAEEKLELVYKHLWKFALNYSINTNDLTAEERVPIWYVMDELGSAIQHSDEPNFRMVPFIHMPEQITYSLLFPIEDVDEGDVVYRNYIEGNHKEMYRDAMLIPWQEYEHYDEDFTLQEPGEDYFSSGRINETLPTLDCIPLTRDKSKKLKVFSQYDRINENLTHQAFEIVGNEEDADILWFTSHFKAYKDLSELAPHKFVNQFPFENILTIKDLLSIVARRKSEKVVDKKSLETFPKWLPTTFNLKTELVKFVAYYHQRQLRGLDNHWICKPFNLARSLDTHITDNLNFIVRLPETGPKVVQKYIENPVLFSRPDCEGKVKFDVRYVILLKSIYPLDVYAYRNFFLRFANKPFALNNFDEYEQHFTVMNYSNPSNLHRMLCADYVVEWAKQYPDVNWSSVEREILKMIKELFECAVVKSPPCGIGQSPQSRALYAADIMLAWEENDKGNKIVQPKLLEVNWMPDCNRACQYYPNFYNDIFSLFFLDDLPDSCIPI